MRSIKTMLLLAFTAALAVAFAVPAVASAYNWTSEGVELNPAQLKWTEGGEILGSKGGTLTLEGPLRLDGELGVVECPMTAVVSLDPYGAGAHLKELKASVAGCKVSGLLKAICSKGVGSVSASGLPADVSLIDEGASRRMWISSELVLTYRFVNSYGGECAVVEYGPAEMEEVTAGLNSSESISSVTWSGEMADNLGGSNKVSGTMTASPSGKYGTTTTNTAHVSGTLGWMGEAGSASCPVAATVELEGWSNEGQLKDLHAIPGPETGECKSAGIGYVGCGKVTSMTSPEPWTVYDEGTYIHIPNAEVKIGFQYCSDSFVGELQAFPDNESAISSTSLDGSLAHGGENVHWSGELDWTPAGHFGSM
jgi:hypothetical protein